MKEITLREIIYTDPENNHGFTFAESEKPRVMALLECYIEEFKRPKWYSWFGMYEQRERVERAERRLAIIKSR